MRAHREGRVVIVLVSPRGEAAMGTWMALHVVGFIIGGDTRLDEVVSTAANRSAIRRPG